MSCAVRLLFIIKKATFILSSVVIFQCPFFNSCQFYLSESTILSYCSGLCTKPLSLKRKESFFLFIDYAYVISIHSFEQHLVYKFGNDITLHEHSIHLFAPSTTCVQAPFSISTCLRWTRISKPVGCNVVTTNGFSSIATVIKQYFVFYCQLYELAIIRFRTYQCFYSATTIMTWRISATIDHDMENFH